MLPLAALSHKLAMLFALCSANRCSELAALDLNFYSVFQSGIEFISGLTKTRRKGPPKEMMIYTFSENVNLCPVNTFLEYKKCTNFALRVKEKIICLLQ